MKITARQLRQIVREVSEGRLREDMEPTPASKPPPLPGKRPASAALPAKGALHKFKADISMLADASARAKEAADSGNAKEALRWLAKAANLARSAQDVLN